MRAIFCSLAIMSGALLCNVTPLHGLLKPMSAVKATTLTRQSQISQAVKKFHAYARMQKALGIQDADVAIGMRKALSIADLLIQSDGTLDTSINSILTAMFISDKSQEYENHILNVLNDLTKFSWKEFFAKVKMPQEPPSVSVQVLRALFSLSPNHPLTDRHVKVAILSALLAPYNQGPVGDCFAVSDVLRDHREYFQHAVQDYQSVVEKGYVERPVDGSTDDFFFLPILADDDCNQSFVLSRSGTIAQTKYGLFDAPGFMIACRMMGGNPNPDLSQQVTQQLFANAQEDSLEITPTQVIMATANILAGSKGGDANALCAQGEYAFSALTNNTVLRAVEAAFAAMAEDRPTDSMRSNINSCVDQTLEQTWKSFKGMDSADVFRQAFSKAFNASYRLVYNLNIPLATISADGSSTDGGFQLYKRDPENPQELGVRVIAPEDFRQLAFGAVTTAAFTCMTEDVQAMRDELKQCISSENFLKNALWNYDDANKQENDPVRNYQTLARTPMQSCDGDNPYEVDDIDTKTDYNKNVQTFTLKDPKDLITVCLNLAKTAPCELLPLSSPQHAFNLDPKNPDILAFTQRDPAMPAGLWLQKRLILPGLQVSRGAISRDIQKTIALAMYDKISQAYGDQASYDTMAGQINNNSLSVKEFGNKLLDGINTLLQADENKAYEIAQVFDAVLLQSLSDQDKALLAQSAVRFALTNWNEGTKDIYFCAYFHPRTEQIAFGTILEDETDLQPMNQKEWVNGQRWDVDLMPLAPVSMP